MREAAAAVPMPGLRALAWAVAGALVASGVYARFVGLGQWPLAMDEYFVVRAVQNLLSDGFAAIDCAGWYDRALLMQYALVPLIGGGVAPELAVRLVAAVASLAVLPAVYLLGRRLADPAVGAVLLVLVAISLWEIEMARFGRMYAPFQAVFVWYLYVMHCVIVDRELRLRWMLVALSVAGCLLWEGGLFLLALNLLPVLWQAPRRRLGYDAATYLVVATLVGVALAAVQLGEVLQVMHAPQVAAGYMGEPPAAPRVLEPLRVLGSRPEWLALALGPIAAMAVAWRRSRAVLDSTLARAGLVMVLALLALHQGALAILAAAGLVLAGWLPARALQPRVQPWLWLAAGASVLFWLIFMLAVPDWILVPDADLALRFRLIAGAFLKHPAIFAAVVEPWREAVPVLGLAMLALLATALVQALGRAGAAVPGLRLLVLQVLLLLAAVGFANPMWQETRYVFFLYPAVLVAGIVAVFAAMRRHARTPAAATAASVLVIGGAFVATEDFDVHHFTHVADADVVFRAGYPWPLARHFYQRYDFRAAGDWLGTHAGPNDLVLSAVSGFDYYYRSVAYLFRHDWHPVFAEEACYAGTRHRWSNLPLLHRPDDIRTTLGGAPARVWLVTTSDNLWMNRALGVSAPSRVWLGRDGHLQILSVAGKVGG